MQEQGKLLKLTTPGGREWYVNTAKIMAVETSKYAIDDGATLVYIDGWPSGTKLALESPQEIADLMEIAAVAFAVSVEQTLHVVRTSPAMSLS